MFDRFLVAVFLLGGAGREERDFDLTCLGGALESLLGAARTRLGMKLRACEDDVSKDGNGGGMEEGLVTRGDDFSGCSDNTTDWSKEPSVFFELRDDAGRAGGATGWALGERGDAKEELVEGGGDVGSINGGD